MPSKSTKIPEFTLVVWGLLFNGIWEFAHSSLYSDHAQGLVYVIWSRLHCSVGDVMILLGSFWATSLLVRSRQWPTRKNYVVPATMFLLLGLGYTIFSEWLNTHVRESWTYSSNMPVLFHTGLSPMLQWIVIPPTLVWIMRRSSVSSVWIR